MHADYSPDTRDEAVAVVVAVVTGALALLLAILRRFLYPDLI